VAADFGANSDGREDVVSLDVDLVVGEGTERGDEVWGGGV